jgi:ribosome-binding factor A
MSKRLQRINSLLKEEIGKIILREIEFPSDILLTVTRVETTPNLIESKVYISVMPEKRIQETLNFLDRRIYFLQKKLDEKLKMRPIPKIRFIEEKRTREAARVEELLENLKNKEK